MLGPVGFDTNTVPTLSTSLSISTKTTTRPVTVALMQEEGISREGPTRALHTLLAHVLGDCCAGRGNAPYHVSCA